MQPKPGVPGPGASAANEAEHLASAVSDRLGNDHQSADGQNSNTDGREINGRSHGREIHVNHLI